MPKQPSTADRNGHAHTTYADAFRPDPHDIARVSWEADTGTYLTVRPTGPLAVLDDPEPAGLPSRHPFADAAVAIRRRIDAALGELRIRARAKEEFDQEEADARRAAAADADLMVDGADFLFNVDPVPSMVWGTGTTGLWTDGEALMIVGPQGVGKTGISGQLVRALLGLMPRVLDIPVTPTAGNIVYWAMDRPKQAQRSLARMFAASERERVAGRLKFWPGPPPGDFATDPDVILDVAERHNATVMVVDSLKDAALGLSTDEAGAGYNRARQTLLRAGVQLLELHHMRKPAPGHGAHEIADVYGSAFLTAGAGSVLLLSGNPGDPVVQLSQIKSPLAEMAPMHILHDAATGLSTVMDDPESDVTLLARHSGRAGISPQEAAIAMYAVASPTKSQVEKARRELERKAESGILIRVGGERGTGRGNTVRYALAAGPWAHDLKTHRMGEVA